MASSLPAPATICRWPKPWLSPVRLAWHQRPVMDKHCVGGLPGNRTTPIVVAIVAACGLTIPKTSSRAITSPAGTADTMEVLAPVNLTLKHMRRVVDSEGGCIVWAGAMALSPADDILIQVERPLDFDSDGQLAASILSKKIAAGSTHLVIDLPVGPTAKVRTPAAAIALTARLAAVAKALDLQLRVVVTDGSQPVGRGIGPVLEALDVLAVLGNQANAPQDLRERALLLAGHLLELAGTAEPGSGAAQKKFEAGLCQRAQQHSHDWRNPMNPCIVSLPGNQVLGAALAEGVGGEVVALQTRRFPNRESYLRLLAPVRGRNLVRTS